MATTTTTRYRILSLVPFVLNPVRSTEIRQDFFQRAEFGAILLLNYITKKSKAKPSIFSPIKLRHFIRNWKTIILSSQKTLLSGFSFGLPQHPFFSLKRPPADRFNSSQDLWYFLSILRIDIYWAWKVGPIFFVLDLRLTQKQSIFPSSRIRDTQFKPYSIQGEARKKERPKFNPTQIWTPILGEKELKIWPPFYLIHFWGVAR